MAVPVVPSKVQTGRPQVQALGPDSRALAVAELLQARVHPHAVYLFGSRARGDWGDDSDIDLMVLTPEKLPASVTGALASSLRPVAERLFGQPVGLQIFNYAQAEFNWARTSPNHLAGGVQRDGLNPEGKPMPPVQQNNPWPDVQQRLRATRRSLHDAFKSHGNDHDHVALSCAHNAIENALKAYASVCGVRYNKNHALGDLVQQIQTRESGEAFPDQDWLDKLSKFRVISPYLTEYPLPFAASEAVLVAQALCSRLASRVLHRSGKTPADVKYETLQYETEDLKRPLGGLEDADPVAFRVDLQLDAAHAQGHAQGSATTKREALLDIARILCDTNQLSAFEQELDSTPWPDWPDVKDVYWRFRQSEDDGMGSGGI